MRRVLNFICFLFVLSLSFVSFLNTSSAKTSTSGGENTENPPVEIFNLDDETPIKTPRTSPSSKTDEEKKRPPATSMEDKIENLKDQIRKSPQNIQKIIDLAELFYERADYEKTTLLLWKQIDKLDRKGLMLLARAHEKRKEPAEMIRALNIQLGKNDKDFEAHTLIGNAYSLQKKSKDALEHYKTAIELNDKYEAAYLAVEQLYEQRNPPNLYELRILFQDMIEKMGPRAEYLEKLCNVNSQDDSTIESAIESCKQATQKNPKAADAFVNLGTSLKLSGKTDQGIAVLKKAAQDFPKSEYAQYTYGRVLEDQKNTIEAMRLYKAGADANPTSARSWMGLANTAFDIKKYEIALIAFKNACRYDKKNAVAFRRATTFLRNNKTTDWIRQFEAGSEACP